MRILKCYKYDYARRLFVRPSHNNQEQMTRSKGGNVVQTFYIDSCSLTSKTTSIHVV